MNNLTTYQDKLRAQRVTRYNEILMHLQTPMTLKQLSLAMGFKSKKFHTEATELLDGGYLEIAGKDLKGIGQKKCYLYKTLVMPYGEEIKPAAKTNSTIHRLIDKNHWSRSEGSERVYVSGSTLSGF